MSDFALALGSFPILIALLLLRVPIGLTMFAIGIIGTTLILGSPKPVLAQLKSVTFDTFANYSLSIVPLFLLMGQFASRSGLSRALFQAAQALLGPLRGGVPMAAIGACGGFGAIAGSSLATAATMGQVALPELKRLGTSPTLAAGSIAAGGTLGILIPPSIVLVIYAVLADQNIEKLFIAALLPGLLALFGYLAVIAILVQLNPEAGGSTVRTSRLERALALRSAWPVAAIFFLVVGGLYLGWFTPTQSAAIGAVATLMLAIRNGITRRGFAEALLETASMAGMIYFIILGAAIYNGFLGYARLPQEILSLVGTYELSPWAILITILVAYVLLGCIMDSLSIILLTVPIFFPMVAAMEFGLSPEEFALWFGILVLATVEIGLITPPVGLNLFVIAGLDRTTPIQTIFRGVLPFIASDLVRITILISFPAISLILVRWLF